jgi:Cft2 family RNA processing exonuclease
VDYVKQVAPAKVLLVHGDPPAQAWFQQTLTRELPQSEIVMPEGGEQLALW